MRPDQMPISEQLQGGQDCWKIIHANTGEYGDFDYLQACAVDGGVFVRNVIVVDKNISSSMVFIPGFEITSDGDLRKL
jgi:hypothetical protein